ncbi:unnamed protein product [Arctogadus glacialis]
MGTMGQGHWDDLRHGQSSLLPVLLSLTPQVSGATGQGLAPRCRHHGDRVLSRATLTSSHAMHRHGCK